MYNKEYFLQKIIYFYKFSIKNHNQVENDDFRQFYTF